MSVCRGMCGGACRWCVQMMCAVMCAVVCAVVCADGLCTHGACVRVLRGQMEWVWVQIVRCTEACGRTGMHTQRTDEAGSPDASPGKQQRSAMCSSPLPSRPHRHAEHTTHARMLPQDSPEASPRKQQNSSLSSSPLPSRSYLHGRGPERGHV
jgi:hypothetical protein